MLAQNFKTAADLGLKEKERDALIGVLGMLERQELKHLIPASDREIKAYIEPRAGRFSGHFNMAWWSNEHQCGTVCCIGGTAETLFGIEFELNRGLNNLFYPRGNVEMERITSDQAAAALRNYLTTGEARWAEVLS